MFLIGFKDAYFHISSSIFCTISWSCLGWQSLPVQGTLFRPFHSSTRAFYGFLSPAGLQRGEIKPQDVQHSSVSWDADGCHPRESFPNRLLTVIFQDLADKLLLLPAKMWLQPLGLMASLELFITRGRARMRYHQWRP